MSDMSVIKYWLVFPPVMWESWVQFPVAGFNFPYWPVEILLVNLTFTFIVTLNLCLSHVFPSEG